MCSLTDFDDHDHRIPVMRCTSCSMVRPARQIVEAGLHFWDRVLAGAARAYSETSENVLPWSCVTGSSSTDSDVEVFAFPAASCTSGDGAGSRNAVVTSAGVFTVLADRSHCMQEPVGWLSVASAITVPSAVVQIVQEALERSRRVGLCQ